LARKERLEELDRERPELILMPEPENMNDPMAIRVYAKGASVGYVAHEETHEAYRLFDASQSMARARFVQIDTTRNGDFIAEAELPVEALIKPQPKPVRTEAWKNWKCIFPKLSMPLAWKECHVLEYQMEELFAHPDERNIKLLKDYMKVWTDKSLHDFSVDAMQLRKRYIGQLRTLGLEQNAQRLERQYAAISSAHRMTYRMKWWKELQQTDEMELYWNAWRSGRMDDNLWSDLHQVDSQLRHMPDGLYSQIADLTCLFSAMRYHDNVSRPVLWEVYTLLLLRERICRELGIAMKPMPVHAYGVEEEKEDIHVSPLTDARLAKAVEECQPYFWAKSAWAVVYCVCRDCFGLTDNVSAFEKRANDLPFSKQVKNCPTNTIHTAFGNHPYMKKHISKWEDKRALKLVMALKAALE
jgi:hypothetical protein